MAKAVWNDDDVRLLIEKYRDYPVLWKKDHDKYGKREPREKAWRQLTTVFHGKSK
jgi:Alcohol dehydrogenase transcription factor Myb/SANT-like